MRTLVAMCLLGLPAALLLAAAAESEPNTLTPDEEAAGWQLLFDGQTAEHWRNFRRDELRGAGWQVEDGCLKLRANGRRGGDICSREKWAEFEFSLDVRLTRGANSGVMYHVNDEVDPCWHTGPEVAIQEEPNDRLNKHSFGALYDMIAPSADRVLVELGGWNRLYIKLAGGRGEHWVNGRKVVEYERYGETWDTLVAASKFAEFPRFGREREGYLCIQDHGNEVWFRNLKLRVIDATGE